MSRTESLVHSKFHPSRPCSACVLCGKTSAYYTHLAVWKEEERAFLYDGELADDSCMAVGRAVSVSFSADGPVLAKLGL